MSNLAKSRSSNTTNRIGGIDYSAIVRSGKFRELMAAKKKFIIPLCIFYFVFYFALPIMTSYSKVLNTPAFGPITWAWVFAFAQFIMTWSLCSLYTKKAAGFDKIVEDIVEENNAREMKV
ncbi:DUF485 domain-containing protein [Aneurinibacillus sp. Ricciae_BoGa-3]|uniref:DUF485 domain-containing protein n=1 Tax=Aneurinibacillus sp. Ricciae_BoGa-3 TaxID=3022697 RepID=UPI002341EA9F|nr:DUF485 domain-containing protein [Aneurinibacillus sp. Ricciae_BoGa-3]WCK55783.1 DUF485 domain-containing protein [Aneurinibacillus sp. Ricciae_BoGa-3]